ncbi:MAG: serine--tRNA ligase [Alphaproteobacteria bacterium]|nr:serine--tRNA ligase [Alphaproteobacteria bacterium]
MFDLKWIRENPEALDHSLERRGAVAASSAILKLDSERRSVQTRLQEMQNRRNAASKEIGKAMGDGRANEVEALKQEVGDLKAAVQEAEQAERDLSTEMQALLEGLPNVLDNDIPDGTTEDDNTELRRVGTPPEFSFEPREHFEIGEALGLMDFDAASRLSGSRFVVLKGALARMERALAQFMLDIQTTEFGYTEVSPPLLVRDDALYGTGQLPKFADDLFRTTEDHWLIPTAEVPLTNMVADSILDEADLPIRMTAHTSCFRAEAGAAGKDTRGMLRQHQFYKVELVSIVHPDRSEEELERMTGCAEAVLQRLGLAYRVVVLCSGDTGFAATKTHDIDVWLPGQKTYREISSCSNTRDFQARRMKARFRPAGETKCAVHVHTLNGSGVAIGRALIAVIENYQREDGSIGVPDALRPYMGGLEAIAADA